ncbi:Hypothetical protein CINCED_3A012589, partial [Cinara cedri]
SFNQKIHYREKEKRISNKFKNKIKTDTDVNDGKKKCYRGLLETLMDSNEARLGLSDEDIKSHVITIVAALSIRIFKVYNEFYSTLGSCLKSFGDYYEKALNYGQSYNYGSFKLWFGSHLMVVIPKPEDLEINLNSSLALGKGVMFNMAIKFLEKGLVTAPAKCILFPKLILHT